MCTSVHAQSVPVVAIVVAVVVAIVVAVVVAEEEVVVMVVVVVVRVFFWSEIPVVQIGLKHWHVVDFSVCDLCETYL